ncbi:MAG: phosphoribosylglycinamide formyltransferase [Tannerellaceae bacterium]|jgi:phosphoribosylglycinamide formyltransferase-1|nr:phosphoribosylglycinamide formyltransferase [Tannerellaceae bacterium]
MMNIAILASGSGSNAENIIKYFAGSDHIKVALVVSNNPKAAVLERAARLGVPSFVFTAADFADGGAVVRLLAGHGVGFIVLAGFMNKITAKLLDAYPGSIINIHPALLPKYGGKGMYGINVHKAVVKAGEEVSGITIHYINEQYDRGEIIFQASCPISPADTPQDVAAKIHALEHEHYPRVIAELLRPLGR